MLYSLAGNKREHGAKVSGCFLFRTQASEAAPQANVHWYIVKLVKLPSVCRTNLWLLYLSDGTYILPCARGLKTFTPGRRLCGLCTRHMAGLTVMLDIIKLENRCLVCDPENLSQSPSYVPNYFVGNSDTAMCNLGGEHDRR